MKFFEQKIPLECPSLLSSSHLHQCNQNFFCIKSKPIINLIGHRSFSFHSKGCNPYIASCTYIVVYSM